MKPPIILCHLLLYPAMITATVCAAEPRLLREGTEWCDIWIAHADKNDLPRVLLVGDSITRAYYSEVENRLDGKAYVARLATSRFLADPVFAQELRLILAE